MRWTITNRASRRGRPIADRHYNRQSIGSPQFVPPGRCVVLITPRGDALWVSSWPFAEYVKHEWAGAWVCSCFRNESPHLASELNIEAVAATHAVWPDIPEVPSIVGPVGMVSFIDRDEVQPIKVRGKKVWGWSWLKCGWEVIGETKGGLLALGLRSERIPLPLPPIGYQPLLFACSGA
jgi:hypothetical protein